jgi:hypothetical protein
MAFCVFEKPTPPQLQILYPILPTGIGKVPRTIAAAEAVDLQDSPPLTGKCSGCESDHSARFIEFFRKWMDKEYGALGRRRGPGQEAKPCPSRRVEKKSFADQR